MARRRRALVLTAAGLVLVTLVLAWRWGPALTLAVGLAVPSAETWLPGRRESPRQEVRLAAGDHEVLADLYPAARPRAALLLVHGLSREGRRHPELARLARLLARHGQTVLVPQFAGLAAFRLSGREVVEIRAGLEHLTARHARVGIAGFSFGAGPALLAAAEAPGLALVASFGGYADLARVIAYLGTGVHAHGNRRYADTPEPYNRWKLLALLAGFVDDGHDRARLEGLARRKLEDPGAAMGGLEMSLGPEGQAVLALVLNGRPEQVDGLLARLSPRAREALEGLSPERVAGRLPGRVLIAHGAGDVSIPFTESLRLAEAAGPRARVVILRTFHHTGPRPFWSSLAGRVADGLRLLSLADALLAGE